jgi:hypothetical protein
MLVACLTLAVVTGCDGLGARASASVQSRATVPPSALTVTIDDGATRRSCQGTDVPGGQFTTPEIHTRTAGSLHVDYVLAPGGTEISRGGIVLPLRADRRWGVTVRIDSTNPTTLCFGCIGSVAFPLLPS